MLVITDLAHVSAEPSERAQEERVGLNANHIAVLVITNLGPCVCSTLREGTRGEGRAERRPYCNAYDY